MLGFCRTEDAVKVAEAVLTVQRDWGDRKNRKHARLKYTIEERVLDAFRAEVEKRSGFRLAPGAAPLGLPSSITTILPRISSPAKSSAPPASSVRP